jgi:hypothetical protein
MPNNAKKSDTNQKSKLSLFISYSRKDASFVQYLIDKLSVETDSNGDPIFNIYIDKLDGRPPDEQGLHGAHPNFNGPCEMMPPTRAQYRSQCLISGCRVMFGGALGRRDRHRALKLGCPILFRFPQWV